MYRTIPQAPNYEITSDGSNIRRKLKSRQGTYHYLRPLLNNSGYYTVSLRVDGRYWKQPIHRLVMFAWGPPPPFKGAVVRHLNDIKSDCSIENLAWGSQKDNTADQYRNNEVAWNEGRLRPNQKLTPAKVREIKCRLRAGESKRAIARDFGVDHSTIWAIRSGKTWAMIE